MEIHDLNKLFLLNETLVEKLLNIFKDDFKLDKHFPDLDSLKTYLINLAAKDGITLKFENRSENKSIGGKFIPFPHEIIIYLPEERDFSVQEVFNAFFHEYSHYLNEVKLKRPGFINPRREKQEGDTEYIDPPIISYENIYLYNKETILRLLQYSTQFQEKSQVAFSIAYDIYDSKPVVFEKQMNNYFNKPDRDLIDRLVKSHEYFWEKNNTEYQIEKYVEGLRSNGAKMLFALVVVYLDLTNPKHPKFDKNNQELINSRFEKLIELIRKYYRRLVGVMLYAKQNKNKLLIFRVRDKTDKSDDSRFPIGKD